jgi:hypothetical protein
MDVHRIKRFLVNYRLVFSLKDSLRANNAEPKKKVRECG